MKRLKLGLGALFVLLLAGGVWGYWRYSTLYPATRDAYVGANIVTIAAEVTGTVAAVDVVENQRVSAGDPLFELDGTTYRNALTQARAEADSARAAVDAASREIAAAEANVASARASNDTADAQLGRVQTLFDRGDAARSALDDARAGAAGANAALDAATAALARARMTEQANRDALVAAQARLGTAETDLARTKVVAPTDGWIANLDLDAGSTVTAYQPLFALIDPSEWWVDANFKETDLPRIRDGQPVKVSVDMLPGKALTGTVTSVAHGSGASFALLPAENASGNWVKVTRRFGVRIRLDPGNADLRVGASATARVDTTGAPS